MGKMYFMEPVKEKSFINFISGFIEELKQKYSDIALLRNKLNFNF